MKYTYEIVKISPKQEFMTVVYRAEGQPDYIRNFNPRQFDEAHLVSLIEGSAPAVVESWERLASHPESVEIPMSGSGVAEAPVIDNTPIEPAESLPVPDHNPYTHRVEQESWEPGDATVGWTVIELTAEEKAQAIENGKMFERQRRTGLLFETDHWMLSDTPSPTQAQLDYRQALRDVPQQSGFPQNIAWPTKPE